MFGISNVRTDVDACDSTQGLYRCHKRVCTGSWLWKKNCLPHQGLEPMSVLPLAFQSDALPTELSLPLKKGFCFFVVDHVYVQPLTQSPDSEPLPLQSPPPPPPPPPNQHTRELTGARNTIIKKDFVFVVVNVYIQPLMQSPDSEPPPPQSAPPPPPPNQYTRELISTRNM